MTRRLTHCPNGHEYALVGRYAHGRCAECRRLSQRRHYARHIDRMREEHREWSRADRAALREARNKEQLRAEKPTESAATT